jgi:hypothetical protein
LKFIDDQRMSKVAITLFVGPKKIIPHEAIPSTSSRAVWPRRDGEGGENVEERGIHQKHP